ncbi:MAG: beta-lactamase family protein [Microscillaceae bacterium]|jgi:CubicO group peptidase (beta-lactamase class C family)|nr:beta-lactamase family protein [Microscillaceae bacterium]
MKKFLKYLLYLVLGLVIFFFILTAFPQYNYLRKVFYYQKTSLSDYQIFANRTVKAAKQPQIWDKAPDYNQAKIPADQLKEVEGYGTVAFLVIQNGKIKFEQYWQGYHENSLSNSFSVAKSIVSLLIGIARDEGKIKSLDQKVADYLPEFKTGKKADIRIKDLLTMSGGLNWSEAYLNPLATVANGYFGEDIAQVINDLQVSEEPGKKFSYESGDTQILGFVLAKATGKSISEYASEKLWQPLGAKNDALWSLDKADGKEKAFCCFNTNARDFARLGQLVLQKGKWNDRQIVSEKYLQEATSAAAHLQDAEGNPVDFYGYQFWRVKHQNLQIPYMRGVGGQFIFIIPDKNAVIVRLGHRRSNTMRHFTPIDVFMYLDIGLKMLD